MSTMKKRVPMFLLALAMMVAMALPTFADWSLQPDSQPLNNNYLNIYRNSSSEPINGKKLILFHTSEPGYDQKFTVEYRSYGGISCMYLTKTENGVKYAINRSSETFRNGKRAIMWSFSAGLKDSAFKMPISDSNYVVNLLNYNEGLRYTQDITSANVYFAQGGSSAWFVEGTPTL